jgi:hypothetical protein
VAARSLEDLMAEAEIRDVHLRFCRGVDRTDFELLRTCFHPDAVIDFGFFEGDVDRFIELSGQSVRAYTGTTHVTGNQQVEVNGGWAWAEHYTHATHRIAADENGPERDYVTSMRYIDVMERRDGRWAIARRALVLDWSRTDPVQRFGTEPKTRSGERNPRDISYELRRHVFEQRS